MVRECSDDYELKILEKTISFRYFDGVICIGQGFFLDLINHKVFVLVTELQHMYQVLLASTAC